MTTGDITLTDAGTTVRIDAATGGVLGVDGPGGTLVAAPHPGLFVLEIPRDGDRTVVVQTREQRVSEVRMRADGRGVELVWRELVTSAGERLAGTATATLELHDGRLDATLRAGFDDDVRVEAVRFPSLPGVVAAGDGRLELVRAEYTQGSRHELLPRFESTAPYWGTVFPDYASGNLRPEVVCNPTSPFILLARENDGLAVMPTTPTTEFIGWRASLEPGYADSLLRTGGDGAHPATVTVDAIQVPTGGSSFEAVPMTVAVYGGDWLAGLEAYRVTQNPRRRPRAAWLDSPHSWLQVQLMSTEGEVRFDFATLRDIVDECADAGIGAIQIVGWNEGGQDGLVPVHRPSERLGGEAALVAALARARERGVRAVLYTKYQWVEKPGPYWEEFADSVCLDEQGQPYAQPGPVYHSARKRYGMSTPWYVPLCFSSPALRERFAAEAAQMARWGAAGLLNDESLYHGRALLCFAENHGHEPGASTFTWDAEFVAALQQAALAETDEFIVAAEGAFDGQFEFYDASYIRSASPRHLPIGRRLRPGAAISTALIGFDDRSMVNQCLLYGYAASIEPFHFKGRPTDAPLTVAYVGQVDALRRRLAEWLWTGELEPDAGVRAVGDATPHPYATRWRAAAGGPTVTVVTHLDEGEREFEVDAGDGSDAVVLLPGSDAAQPLAGGRVTVQPGDAAVIVPAELARSRGWV
ncbi:DUF6259 domain-containing protein [Herbiconiux sp. A18JL235]|uniref:DUF6259 domain-containing protein n=1 Tax=Herbiconiux sp. A18JL235 TaxID=3152363 RepID=A0AB39BGG8_9MICO